VNAYVATIRADSRVETVFLNTSPNSIHTNSKHPYAGLATKVPFAKMNFGG